ncbi:hypothetical protein HRTV-25_gp77 [Halorubrum tailed virus 25]|uniref:Uncharacterized protein n=1 Tax=Halorubrum tailed virus 25 TaxID=2878006 RepID=A0AAE9BY24_9CAUD|nr:hypothetical protein M1M37_gp077 [Halorubrum tailed virus 25]UBF22658.1 hypothetical protein HRTV-25_gp77 [Halorubrum tailed virus 25]
MSIETTQSDSTATNQNSDDTEALPNPERGCGFLKQGKAYLRADVGTDGNLPAFVEFEEPIPFKEDRKRSYKQFPGIQFEMSVTGEAGLTRTNPPHEVQNHLDRLMGDRPTGTTAGEMASFHSHDLLMSVGKTHYDTAEEFTAEAKVHGVNKAISVTSGNEPPVVNPGRTRLFLIHPRAVEVTTTEMEEQEVEKTEEVELPNGDTKTVSYTETEMVEVEKTDYVPGVFGYTYLTRVVYTEDADGNVPKYIQDYEATGALDVVDVGEPVPFAEQEGFDAEGNPVDDEQELLPPAEQLMEIATDDAEPIDLEEAYPQMGAPDMEDMGRADLGTLAEAEQVKGWAPEEEHDAFATEGGDVLAVLRENGEPVVVRGSNNVSIDGKTATSVVGPYRVTVEDIGYGKRMVSAENTR